MGHGHSHRRADEVELGTTARRGLLGCLVIAAVATIAGAVLLWPDSDRVDDLRGRARFAGPGVTFPIAIVDHVGPVCPHEPTPDGTTGSPSGSGAAVPECGQLEVTVLEGEGEGSVQSVQVPPHVTSSGLAPGDGVRLMRIPAGGDVPAAFSYFGTDREVPLQVLAIAFLFVTVLVAGKRGALAVLGLGFAGAVIGVFLLPGLLSGGPAIPLGLVACSAIMFVVIYTTHGFSMRSTVALAGTLIGVALTGLLGWLSVGATRLSGVGDESGGLLASFDPELALQGILTCAVMIAGLGVLNDVTITQASSAWELRAAAPSMSRLSLWTSTMRIGRDHIASTIYTIAFAYTGTALTLLMLLQLYELPLADLLATEDIAQEVVRTLTTSIGLVLAVPITTLLAVALVPSRPPPQEADTLPDLEHGVRGPAGDGAA